MGFLKNEDQSIDLTELLICIIMKDWLLLPSRDIHVLRSFIPNGIFIIRSNLHSNELYNICIPSNSSLVCNLRYGILRMRICRLLIIKYEYSVIYVLNNDICITSVWHLYGIYMTSIWLQNGLDHPVLCLILRQPGCPDEMAGDSDLSGIPGWTDAPLYQAQWPQPRVLPQETTVLSGQSLLS